MGSLLVEGWLGGADEIRIHDHASVSQVREAVRQHGGAHGLASEVVESLVAAASELVHNQLKHARQGVVGVRAITRRGVAGLEVIAADQGPGIADPSSAMRGEPRPGGGLGIGLSAAYRLADEMDVDVRWGEGTCVWVRNFATPLPRNELAILGRPCAGEARSGDQAVFVREDAALVLSVIDGLGHGEPAREAADLAVATLRAQSTRPPAELLADCDLALEKTRGAVMAVARVDLADRTLEHAGAGNVTSRLYRQGVGQSFLSTARVLGARHRTVRIPVEHAPLGADATLVMFSDGLSTRADLAGELELLRQPPLVIAHELLRRFGRSDDDALVLVARLR